MQIHIVPILADNLSYILVDEGTGQTAVVDPASPSPIISYIHRNNLSMPNIVLTTHRHTDHAGGNQYFHDHVNGITIVGGAQDNVSCCTRPVQGGDIVYLGSIPIQVLASPCHTIGHVMYYINHEDQRYLFTGDTFFIAGCGRFFEGNANDMFSNIQKIIDLPHDTKMYCGHEYTLNNLKFAKHVEPANLDILKKLEWAQECRNTGRNTVPSTIAEELKYNPFLRVDQREVGEFTGTPGDPVKTLEKLRRLKNSF